MSSPEALANRSAKDAREAMLRALVAEAAALAGTAEKMSQAARQALEEGGEARIQPQIAFLTGSLARLLKDWGAIELLQGWRKSR